MPKDRVSILRPIHMPSAVVYLLFFCSGVSGLIYQVLWVRHFGIVFGNTIYSSSIVLATFMLGLGVGSYAAGRWADRRYAAGRESLLRSYGYTELLIAATACGVTLLLPSLGPLAARFSSYVADGRGWFVLSPVSYLARCAIAILLLAPVTLLMGATLTLLIRHLITRNVAVEGSWKIAWLYGVNTLGAAVGAFGTDYLLVPLAGLRSTQLIAVLLNVLAGGGALWLARDDRRSTTPRPDARRVDVSDADSMMVAWTGAAIALSGFAAMGMEIVWLRHFTLLLGSFRSVFSLLMTIVLVSIGAGALLGAVVNRFIARPAETLIGVLALFVCAVLAGLASAQFPAIDASRVAAWTWTNDLWHNVRPMLLETGLPSLLIGSSFPLANAVIQRTEAVVGRRAGVLYLANTIGAVAGSLIAGFVLLPHVGMQGSATVLMTAAGLAMIPLAFTINWARAVPALAFSGAIAAGAMAMWLRLAPDHVIRQALAPTVASERSLSLSEGVDEVIQVTEDVRRGRGLITNGHPMSSTAWLDQRYMRALSHVPLLSIERRARVLVIGFGVGNSTHAAALHTSVERIDVADLSRGVLEHAGYFRDVNGDVLADSRVRVFVNDGRQHLQMQPPGAYDLITLEPPPIAHAGVAALYSREFYDLARTRLKPGGYLSQWLPAYQVPAATSLGMVRAFVDAFPESVLLSGMGPELLLIGTTAPSIEINPERVARAIEREPRVQADLRRLDLGTPTEIVGMFVGSKSTLAKATAAVPATTDDRPVQEYAVRSAGEPTRGTPAALFDVGSLPEWCPGCFDGSRLSPLVPRLDTYLTLLDTAYRGGDAGSDGEGEHRVLLGSRYLGTVVPDSAAAHNAIGAMHIREAEELTETGHTSEAIEYLRRAVTFDAHNGAVQYQLGRLLLDRGQFKEAAECFRSALESLPTSSSLHNDFGVALASSGNLEQAVEQFRRAVSLDPGFDEARRNLANAERATRVE